MKKLLPAIIMMAIILMLLLTGCPPAKEPPSDGCHQYFEYSKDNIIGA